MPKSWAGYRAFRVVHNIVKNDYNIVNILFQMCTLFLHQLYLNCKYSLFCDLTLNALNIPPNRPRSF